MTIEYRVVATGKVLDVITGDHADQLTYQTGEARQLVEQIMRRLAPADRMPAISDWSNGYTQLARVRTE